MTVTVRRAWGADAGGMLLHDQSAVAPSPIALLRSRDVSNADREVSAGRLVRVRRGVLAPAAGWDELAPWDRYLARVHAVALTQPGVVFSHESAAALWRMPVLGDPRVVHVTADPTRSARLVGGVRLHTSSDHDEVVDVAGILIATPGSTAVSLARSRHPALGLASADAALRVDPALGRDHLIDDNEHRATARGRRYARWALQRADGQAASVLESFSRAVIEWLGFPEPDLQRPFPTGHGSSEYADFWWEWLRLVGEADGDLKYDGRFGDGLQQLQRRRDRDLRLLAADADNVVHWGWPELRLIDPVRAALTGAGLRAVHPEDSAALASFRALLFSR
ncbi:hypothetical protein [Microbacterium sp.]|uniref:hypothetical protein n=1 Tax=Microbacterium sp. TaxID=51671 RepID=UPI003A87ED8A